MNEKIDPCLLRLHPADNVLTVIAALEPGMEIEVAGGKAMVEKRLPIGHKVAAHAIARGERIVKYGAPIGSATAEIAAGEHVHTHNVRSDYLPTVLREDQARYFAGQQHQQQHQAQQ